MVVSAAFVVAVVYYIAKALFSFGVNVQPGSNAWKTSVANLRNRMGMLAQNLTPWDGEMLSLLSLNRAQVKKASTFNPVETGVFTTIYQEPVVAYSTQQSGKNRLTVAKTSNREFVYRQKDRETEIWLNGQPLGVLVDGALLAPGRTSKLLAQVDLNKEESMFPLVLQDKTAGAIVNPARPGSSPNPRAVSMLRNVSAEEENLVLALALMQMTK